MFGKRLVRILVNLLIGSAVLNKIRTGYLTPDESLFLMDNMDSYLEIKSLFDKIVNIKYIIPNRIFRFFSHLSIYLVLLINWFLINWQMRRLSRVLPSSIIALLYLAPFVIIYSATFLRDIWVYMLLIEGLFLRSRLSFVGAIFLRPEVVIWRYFTGFKKVLWSLILCVLFYLIYNNQEYLAIYYAKNGEIGYLNQGLFSGLKNFYSQNFAYLLFPFLRYIKTGEFLDLFMSFNSFFLVFIFVKTKRKYVFISMFLLLAIIATTANAVQRYTMVFYLFLVYDFYNNTGTQRYAI